MATKRLKSKAQTIVAQSITDVTDMIGQIGAAERAGASLKLEMETELAAVKAKYAVDINAAAEKIPPLQKAIQAFCEANRASLTNDKKVKTLNLVTGEIAWKIKPPSMRISGEEAVLSMVQENTKYAAFLRTTYTLNRDAMLANQELAKSLTGVSISSGIEEFIITPANASV